MLTFYVFFIHIILGKVVPSQYLENMKPIEGTFDYDVDLSPSQ